MHWGFGEFMVPEAPRSVLQSPGYLELPVQTSVSQLKVNFQHHSVTKGKIEAVNFSESQLSKKGRREKSTDCVNVLSVISCCSVLPPHQCTSVPAQDKFY